MINFIRKEFYGYEDLLKLVTLLRAPGGCPWDAEQTHLSIRRNFLEEAYEACEAFDTDDVELMREELGDVLLQVLFHTDIEREAGRFTIDDVCDKVCKKLIFRHPFVFGEAEGADWEQMKKLEKGQSSVCDTLDAVARSLPSLWRSEKILNKAAKAGVQESHAEQLDILEQAVSSLRSVSAGADAERALGDVLFAAVGAATHLQVDPEQALHDACERFIRRFGETESAAAVRGPALEQLSREELLVLFSGSTCSADKNTTRKEEQL
ncbi:MAG: nucleoside triphosphate pyrophosphohydrolase [Oscillospiraceae bacterium]|nr:nucleoside triphosphate pyrophosphohydrolase [Oscillospiraceae bacterium]